MNNLLQKTKNKMGSSFLSYSARDNNCQNFVRAILQSNGLSNSRNVLFTNQSTCDFFPKDLRKFTSTVTDIASKLDIIKDGVYLIY